jgi:hypothetical protein
MISARYYLVASAVFIGSVAYAARAAQHGDMMPTYVAVILHTVYAVVFLADTLIQRRNRSSDKFRAKFLRPAELRIERRRAF